jgi:exonuclease SbcD
MIGSDIILPLEYLRVSRFNYVALGHIHRHQEIIHKPPVVYSGSLERVDFGEEKEDKGFVLVKIQSTNNKIQTNWQFIKTPARKFLTIPIKINDNDEPMEKIFQAIKNHDISDAIVKVIINIDEEKQSEISENQIRAALTKANYIAGIIKEIQSSLRTQIKNGFSDELSSLDTLGILEKYLKTKKINRSHQEILIKAAQQLIEENQ